MFQNKPRLQRRGSFPHPGEDIAFEEYEAGVHGVQLYPRKKLKSRAKIMREINCIKRFSERSNICVLCIHADVGEENIGRRVDKSVQISHDNF